MGALTNWWSSLSVAEKRYLSAGALGVAGLGVWGVALAKMGKRDEDSDPEVASAVAKAVAQLPTAVPNEADPHDAADAAYWEIYPECPHILDPNDPGDRLCIDLWLRVRDETRFQMGCSRDRPSLEVYSPGSQKQVQLFRQAARLVGVPEEWASDPGLRYVLAHESNGVVGIPNYTYGWRGKEASCWPHIHEELRRGIYTSGIMQGGKLRKSSATGLGQLLLSNVKKYYPSGPAGIGVAVEEAAGMLLYIKDRYGTPEWARNCYGKLCPSIPGKRAKTFKEGY